MGKRKEEKGVKTRANVRKKIPGLGWPDFEKGLMGNGENVLSVRIGRSGMFDKRQGEETTGFLGSGVLGGKV